MSDNSNESVIHVTRPQRIDLPKEEHESRIAIRYIDWERIKNKISRMKNPIPRLHLIYSSLLGISGSSALSSVLISQSQDLPAWVLPLFVCICIFSFISGCGIYWLDKKNRETRVSEIDECLEDMGQVESTFPAR